MKSRQLSDGVRKLRFMEFFWRVKASEEWSNLHEGAIEGQAFRGGLGNS